MIFQQGIIRLHISLSQIIQIFSFQRIKITKILYNIQLKTMPSMGNSFLFLILVFFTNCLPFSINMNSSSVGLVNMYSNGIYNTAFVGQSAPYNCSMNRIFTYSQTVQQKINNLPITILLQNSPSNLSLTLKGQYNTFTPNLLNSNCSNIINNTCTVYIYNNCPLDTGQFNYFNIFQLQISNLPAPFSFNVLCDDTFSTNTFQWGLVILMVFSLFLIVSTVIFSKAWSMGSMGGAGIRINYWLIIGFWTAVGIAGIIAGTTQNVIQPILQVVTLLIGIAGMWVCSNELIFLFKINFLQKGIQIKDIFKIRILDIISLFVGVSLAIGYYFSHKNWIINDFICVCIIIAAIKIMKFTNLKISIFTLCVGLAVQMTFVWVIHFTKLTSYNDLILNSYNFAFQLQLPTINPVYKQKCAWLPFTAIIYPGIFMSYLRRFDLSRNTNIYFITSIAVFIVGSIVWILISVGSMHSWPFQIVTGPLMISLVSVFAYKRRQIRTLWQGSFYDQVFANRDGLNDILDTINEQNPQKHTVDIELRGSLMSSLKINRRDDSDLTMLKRYSNMSKQKQHQSSSSSKWTQRT